MEDIQKLMEAIQKTREMPDGPESEHVGMRQLQQFQVRASGSPLGWEFGAGGISREGNNPGKQILENWWLFHPKVLREHLGKDQH